ncbi:hypothetical protein [Mesorhizobium sp. STM 4661]|uniref:hypothetical protein n=1 Tax=Mesorhizobium sp. STM 4661 TaxID=1297570 RepID=UPI0002BF1095|nr:hypothetical protein [Mesorhizobium sp. STM 4661]CCV10485.1 hypothetical protein MESS4_20061 [Mesorhizobium sp. STM 4661]
MTKQIVSLILDQVDGDRSPGRRCVMMHEIRPHHLERKAILYDAPGSQSHRVSSLGTRSPLAIHVVETAC